MTYVRSYHHDLAADHVCGDADIENLLLEISNLRQDPNLDRYENPDESSMRAILARARTYDGPWYHSEVIFDMDAVLPEGVALLRDELKILPADRGVNFISRFNNPELELKLLNR